MGNSNSQPLVSRLAPSLLHNHQQKENRGKKQPKVVQSPQNRVLPDVSSTQQRLRCTDNGSILQNGGTISGRKSIMAALPDSEPEFLRLLQAKCQAARSSPENASFQTLYGHKKSHSDPDIVRRMMMCDNETDCEDDDQDDRFHLESVENTKSIIAVSPSKAKIKSRKKKRAPEPPHSNTLPRSLDRMAVVYNSDNMLSYKKKEFGDPPRRPLPPIPTDEPPPPPPPPDYNRDPEGQIIVKVPSKNYEKNRRVVDKWRFSKTGPDGIAEERHRQRSKSLDRTEDQRLKESNENHSRFERNLSLKNLSNRDLVDSSPVQRHINKISDTDLKEAIAKMGKDKSLWDRTRYNGNVQLKSNKDFCGPRKQESTNGYSARQYYFSGAYEDRRNSPNEDILNHPELRNSQEKLKMEDPKDCTNNKRRSYIQRKEKDNTTSREKFNNDVVSKQKRCQFQRMDDNTDTCTTQSKWNFFPHDSSPHITSRKTPSVSSSSTDGEIEIDLQLRPTLPRKPLEITKFSPVDAWRSINLDFLKSGSQRSDISSDEGDDVMEEKVHRIHRPVAPRRITHHRSADSGISPDAGSPMFINDSFEVLLNTIPTSGAPPVVGPNENRTAWIPQHDLADEGDTESEVSVPKNSLVGPHHEVQAKFSLPNLMFPSKSLPRTENVIDSMEKNSHTHEKVRRRRSKGPRKQSHKTPEGQHFNSLRNLKKVLGIKNKSLATEESNGLDANWSLSQSLPNFANNLTAEESGRKLESAKSSYLESSRKYGSDARVLSDSYGLMKSDSYTVNNLPNNQNGRSSWGKSFVGQPSEGHVIYLPEYSSPGVAPHNSNASGDEIQVNTDSELVVKKRTGRKKFSYQSTVRQIEKKKLEEQVAREVEEREKKRQQEIEWMNKVEEEFRKQRDKEKVNIRHQLRILHLQNKTCSPATKEAFRNGDCCQDNTEVTKFVKNHPWDSENVCDGKFWTTPATTSEQKQPTGMRKWLRRQNREHSFKHPRPEPEGGRSSSDDGKQTTSQNTKCSEHVSDNRPTVNNSKWSQHTSNNFQSNHVSSSPCVNGRSEITKSLSSPNIPSCSENSERLRHFNSQNCDQQKHTKEMNSEETFRNVDEDHFAGESVEEYELHLKLSRTNSGRTFESHSYYVRADDRKRDDPSSHLKKDRAKTNNSNSVSPSFYKENVKRRAREFERRSRMHGTRTTVSDNDETGSDEADRLRERPQGCIRGQRTTIESQQLREPSFSRNHPHRKGKLQINGKIGHNGSANFCGSNGISSIHT